VLVCLVVERRGGEAEAALARCVSRAAARLLVEREDVRLRAGKGVRRSCLRQLLGESEAVVGFALGLSAVPWLLRETSRGALVFDVRGKLALRGLQRDRTVALLWLPTAWRRSGAAPEEKGDEIRPVTPPRQRPGRRFVSKSAEPRARAAARLREGDHAPEELPQDAEDPPRPAGGAGRRRATRPSAIAWLLNAVGVRRPAEPAPAELRGPAPPPPRKRCLALLVDCGLQPIASRVAALDHSWGAWGHGVFLGDERARDDAARLAAAPDCVWSCDDPRSGWTVAALGFRPEGEVELVLRDSARWMRNQALTPWLWDHSW
jgi:hypothetical protein